MAIFDLIQEKLPQFKFPRQLRSYSIIISMVVIGLGCSVIIGWIFQITWLKSILADRVTMKVSTSLGLIFAATTLLFWHQRQKNKSLETTLGVYILPCIVIAFCGITLIEYGFNLDLGTSWLSLPDTPDAIDAVVGGRMSPNTALNFIFLNLAILLLEGKYYLTSQLMILAVLVIPTASLIGHLYQATLFYSFGSATGMAIHTAISFLLLAVACLATQGERGWMRELTRKEAGGLMARWLLPLTILIPPTVGGVIWYSLQGNRQVSELVVALRITLEMLILGTIIWWTAQKLNNSDRQKQQLLQKLLVTEVRYQRIVEDQTELICRYLNDGTVLYVNDAYCRFFGLDREQALSQGYNPVIYEADRHQVEQLIHSMNQDNPTVTIVNRVWARGRVRWTQWNNRLISDKTGEIKEYQSVGRDITQLKTIEAKLQESELRFRRAFEDAATGEALVSLEGKFIKVNRSLCEIFGYGEAKLLNKTFQEITHPDDLDIDLNYLQQMLLGVIRTYQMEKRYLNSDGKFVWGLLSVSLVKNLDGQPLYFISQIQNIHRRKQAEAKLNALLAELQRSNQELEEFASVVAHDLLSPLRQQNLLIECLEEDYDTTLESIEEGKEYLARIVKLNLRMKDLILNLLTYARVTTQTQPFTTVDLNELVNSVLEEFASKITLLQAKIKVGELPTVTGDPLQLRQLWQNLLQNALKFHSSDRTPEIKIYQILTTTNFYQIKIVDNGIGFEPEQQEKIFTPFHRLYSYSTYEGTGLGLAICDKILQRHQGKIVARSQPQQGATFIIYLPK